MSLRTDFHGAYDELASPMHGLSERVVLVVLAENPSRRRAAGSISSFSFPAVLVAVFLLVALAVGVLIGGRLIQGWNSFHNSAPAGSSYQSEVAQLEAVPLRLPVIHTPADCTSGPYNSTGSFGSGPVYVDGGPASTSQWVLYYFNDAFAETNIAGPILVRARDLFTGAPVFFVGQYAAGPVVGTDTVDGVTYDQHLELLLDTSSASKVLATHKFDWKFIAGVPGNWSGSTGWQIDGIGFSEVFRDC